MGIFQKSTVLRLSNTGAGPIGEKSTIEKLEIGDIIQLSFGGNKFSHSLVVIQNSTRLNNTLVATHTFDAYGRSIASYNFKKIRYLQIKGVRI